MSRMHDVSYADDTVASLLAMEPRVARVLLDHGMHCVDCAIAPFETLAEVCTIYGVPLEQLVVELRGHSASEEKEVI